MKVTGINKKSKRPEPREAEITHQGARAGGRDALTEGKRERYEKSTGPKSEQTMKRAKKKEQKGDRSKPNTPRGLTLPIACCAGS